MWLCITKEFWSQLSQIKACYKAVDALSQYPKQSDKEENTL